MADRVAVMYAGRIVEIGPVHGVVSSPRHPYSRGLMQAIPPLSRRPERLVQILGAMPRLSAVPTGCAFHPRCSSALARCISERPRARITGEGCVACHLYDGAGVQ